MFLEPQRWRWVEIDIFLESTSTFHLAICNNIDSDVILLAIGSCPSFIQCSNVKNYFRYKKKIWFLWCNRNWKKGENVSLGVISLFLISWQNFSSLWHHRSPEVKMQNRHPFSWQMQIFFLKYRMGTGFCSQNVKVAIHFLF